MYGWAKVGLKLNKYFTHYAGVGFLSDIVSVAESIFSYVCCIDTDKGAGGGTEENRRVLSAVVRLGSNQHESQGVPCGSCRLDSDRKTPGSTFWFIVGLTM